MQEPQLATSPNRTVVETRAYELISAHYADRRAERSQVPLINHINEGCIILERIGATQRSAEAFCIHPIIQADPDLQANYERLCREDLDNAVILLAMEYRNVANAFLSDKVRSVEYTRGHFDVEITQRIKLSPLEDVNDMLVADKVQNRKDFLRYHKDSHLRSKELDVYFNEWLKALGITEERYQQLVAGL